MEEQFGPAAPFLPSPPPPLLEPPPCRPTSRSPSGTRVVSAFPPARPRAPPLPGPAAALALLARVECGVELRRGAC